MKLVLYLCNRREVNASKTCMRPKTVDVVRAHSTGMFESVLFDMASRLM